MKRAKVIALPHPFPYGATELKQFSERFTFEAFGFALAIITAVSVIIALLMSFAAENKIEIPKIAGKFELMEFTNKPTKVPHINNIKVPTSFGFKSVAGNPVPTPVSELAKHNINFADIDDLGRVLSVEGNNNVPKDNINIPLGNEYLPNDETELSPEDFIAVEKEPYIDLAELQRKVVYPELARRIGAEGKVIVRVYIGKDGKPLKSIIEYSDNEVLNDAAVKAIMSSIFTPARQNDNPVALWLSIPINFRLR